MPGSAGRALLDLVFPGRCLVCGQWLLPAVDRDAPLCGDCQASLIPLAGERCESCGIPLVSERGTCLRCREADFAFVGSRALFPFSGAPKSLLVAFKFGSRESAAGFLAALAAEALDAECRGWPIVPVPPRPRRGAPDPVALVAHRLAREHGLDVRPLLVRVGGAAQKTLDLAQRRENLKGRIRLARARRGLVVPDRAVVLDDVFTTGATLDACARVLRASGCGEVRGLTFVIEE